MQRALIAVVFTILALASSGRTASAQERPIRDSVASAPVDTGPVVDTASRKWTPTRRDRILANCVSRSMSPIGYLLPVFCDQRAIGLFGGAGLDSVIFMRNGLEYRVAARNIGGVELLNRQKPAHALHGALIGGGIGVFGALIASLQGGEGKFGYTALVLGGTGAMIGGFAGSRYWGNWPRVLQDARH